MPKRRIFRRAALERLSSPEQLDQLMQITSPTGWLALLALGLLLLTAILWAIFGRIPVRVSGQGILLPPGGINDVASPVAGEVKRISVDVGDTVMEGRHLVATIIESGTDESTNVRSPYSGRILELKINEGNIVDRGTPILSIESQGEGEHPLEAIIYVSPTEGKKIRPGMEVQISPSTLEEYGHISEMVTSVGGYPATVQGMIRAVGSEEVATVLAAGKTPIEIHVALTSISKTARGYEWSPSKGAPILIDSGTLCAAWFTICEYHPYELVLPMLRKTECD